MELLYCLGGVCVLIDWFVACTNTLIGLVCCLHHGVPRERGHVRMLYHTDFEVEVKPEILRKTLYYSMYFGILQDEG